MYEIFRLLSVDTWLLQTSGRDQWIGHGSRTQQNGENLFGEPFESAIKHSALGDFNVDPAISALARLPVQPAEDRVQRCHTAESEGQTQQLWDDGDLVKNDGTIPDAEYSRQVDCQVEISEAVAEAV
jgi:hypothetical protein